MKNAVVPSSLALLLALSLPSAAQSDSFSVTGTEGTKLDAEAITDFDEPWALSFLPDGSMLVTTKPGKLFRTTSQGDKTEIAGVPDVTYGGQGGLGDVVPHPDFADKQLVYFSYVDSDDGGETRGAVVARAKLHLSSSSPALTDVEEIWRQQPFMTGKGHFSHRIAFGPKGSEQDGYLFITSGDRQKQTPAQDMEVNLGKIIRLNDDGSVPADNPYQDDGELAKTFWSIGHRNLLGINFDAENRLWEIEMGPRGGDELNLINPGLNYGWPVVSDGDNYSGKPIPDHDTDGSFEKPVISWNPVISPGDFAIYTGDAFSGWKGDAIAAGLSSEAVVHIDIDGETAEEAERFEWGKRIREIEEGPNGAIWVLEDKAGGRLVKLTPAD